MPDPSDAPDTQGSSTQGPSSQDSSNKGSGTKGSGAQGPPSAALKQDQTEYLKVLLVSAAVAIPLSLFSLAMLGWTHDLSHWLYTTLPEELGIANAYGWWAVGVLTVGGLLVGLVSWWLGGPDVPRPDEHGGGPPPVHRLFAVILIGFLSLSIGASLGPEGVLIAIGGGVGVLLAQLFRMGHLATAVMASAGTMAAIAALFASPVVGALLLLEIAIAGGRPITIRALAPGFLAAGIGMIVFEEAEGLFDITKPVWTFTDLPDYAGVSFGDVAWAVLAGVIAAVVCGTSIRLLTEVRDRSARYRYAFPLLPAVAGMAIGLVAVVLGDHGELVLFSGQHALQEIITNGDIGTATLALVLLGRLVTWIISGISGLFGGMIFPIMFLGTVSGIIAHQLIGMPLAVAMAGTMAGSCAVLIKTPISATVLTGLLWGANNVEIIPVTIVSCVVAYLLTTKIELTAMPPELKQLAIRHAPARWRRSDQPQPA